MLRLTTLQDRKSTMQPLHRLRNLRKRVMSPSAPPSIQVHSSAAGVRAWSPGSVTMSFMSCGTYCLTSTRHSAGSTPRAPIALLISAISSTGPTSSDVPESAIACRRACNLGFSPAHICQQRW